MRFLDMLKILENHDRTKRRRGNVMFFVKKNRHIQLITNELMNFTIILTEISRR